VALLSALCALALALLSQMPGLSVRLGKLLAPAGVLAMVLVAVLAIPLKADMTAITTHVSDAGLVGQLPSDEQRPLSSYLLAHQDGARYEVASESATAIGSLIVKDGRPILILTTYEGRLFTSVATLKRLIAEGQVRYAFLNTFCGAHSPRSDPACSPPALWIRAHSTDISRQAGLSRGGVLWRLPGGVA
jgi:hypothetical protein